MGACISEPVWIPLLHSLLFPTAVKGAATMTSQLPPSSSQLILILALLASLPLPLPGDYCIHCPLSSSPSYPPLSTPTHTSSPGTITGFKCTLGWSEKNQETPHASTLRPASPQVPAKVFASLLPSTSSSASTSWMSYPGTALPKETQITKVHALFLTLNPLIYQAGSAQPMASVSLGRRGCLLFLQPQRHSPLGLF